MNIHSAVGKFILHYLQKSYYMLVEAESLGHETKMVRREPCRSSLSRIKERHIRLVLFDHFQCFFPGSAKEDMNILLGRFGQVKYQVHVAVALGAFSLISGPLFFATISPAMSTIPVMVAHNSVP